MDELEERVLALLRDGLPKSEGLIEQRLAMLRMLELGIGVDEPAKIPLGNPCARFVERFQVSGKKLVALKRLVKDAEADSVALEACAMLIDMLSKKQLPLPLPLSSVATRAMRVQASRPDGPGNEELADRNYVIVYAIQMARDAGRTLYRNEATPQDKRNSACDVVSRMLSMCGVTIAPQSVRSIWKRRDEQGSILSRHAHASAAWIRRDIAKRKCKPPYD